MILQAFLELQGEVAIPAACGSPLLSQCIQVYKPHEENSCLIPHQCCFCPLVSRKGSVEKYVLAPPFHGGRSGAGTFSTQIHQTHDCR